MPELLLTVEDLIASAVTSQTREAFGPCPVGTAERMATTQAAVDAGLLEHPVSDLLCHQLMPLGKFIRHCAWVDHTIAHALPAPCPPPGREDEELDEARLRDLGRGGESKTAAGQ